MSTITPDILAQIAPDTPHALRDRFIPFLNEALPRYGITTKLRVGAFLCTTCFESEYFQATKEGKAAANTPAGRAQAHYWSTGFFGRGLIQTTHREGYEAVGEYLASKGVIDDADLFVNTPTLLEQPRWAVESACVFWLQNNLNRYADTGNIFAVEGITNRGNAGKAAWGESSREKIYRTIIAYLPDDFNLSAANALSPDATASPTGVSLTNDVVPSNLTDDSPPSQPISNDVDAPTTSLADTPAASGGLLATATSYGDKLSTWQMTFAKLNPANYLPTTPSGLGTKILTGAKTVGGALMMAGGAIWNHWEWLVAGVVLLIVAAILWDRSRQRNNSIGSVPPQMINTAVAAAVVAPTTTPTLQVTQTNEAAS